MAHELGESDWGDWLLREVSDADPETVRIWYLGCNGLVLKGREGTTVFVDPYCGTGDPPRTVRMVPVPFDPTDVESADAVFATHEHSDHVHGPTQGPILAGTGATYYGPDDSLAVVDEESWTDAYDVGEDQFAEVTEGDRVDVGEFTVHVEPANDPDATHPVSYAFEHDAGTVFHGGDTKPTAAFEEVAERRDVDLAVLAFGSVGMLPAKDGSGLARKRWYNDENQIIETASTLEADRLVPTHWDMWRGLTADPTALHRHASSFDYPRRLDVLEIGDSLEI
jgi:L-ascorbate 6-phosphate lactonase